MSVKKITITELAKRLKVSPSTISRALRGHPSIGTETRQKIRQLATELGYVPNSLASNLRRQKTNLIGVIVPRIDRDFHSSSISGIEEVANELGYYVAIFQTGNEFRKEIENVNHLLANKADGVIACLGLNTKTFEHYEKLKANKVPLVLYDRISNAVDASKVFIDDFGAAFEACEHLIAVGAKKIAHIAGNQNSMIFRKRAGGYKACLERHGLRQRSEWLCLEDDLSIVDGVRCCHRLLDMADPPDAIFCANDNSAIGVIQTAKKRKIAIPGQLAVVGFSNTPYATIIEPNLTTIADHAFEMGRTAAQLLVRQIEDKKDFVVSESIRMRHALIIRESTKK